MRGFNRDDFKGRALIAGVVCALTLVFGILAEIARLTLGS
jgi:hypothetical protein